MSDDEQQPPSLPPQEGPTGQGGAEDDGPTHPGIGPPGEPSLEPQAPTEPAGPPELDANPPERSPEHAGEPQPSPAAEEAAPAPNPFASPGPAEPLIEPPQKPHWKDQLHGIGQKLQQSQWVRELGQRIQNFEPAQAVDWASKKFQRQNAGLYTKAGAIALCAFFVADLMALIVGKYIPEPPITHARSSGYRRPKSMDDYGIIFARNLFNSNGVIPGEGTPTPGTPAIPDNNPVRTTLPFNLIGTVILQDELRSIATIEDKSVSIVYPVRETDEIPSKAKIVKIEPRKVIFVNSSSGRLEFIDLPEENTPAPTAKGVSVTSGRNSTPGIEKVAPNQFNVQRSEVDKALADLNKVLTEARAVPNFENGVANGYKLFQIVPGSIYDKLGLQNGDVITGLNGTPINDPGKAFEMLSELKTSNHLELQVKKDGKVQNNIYDIR